MGFVFSFSITVQASVESIDPENQRLHVVSALQVSAMLLARFGESHRAVLALRLANFWLTKYNAVDHGWIDWTSNLCMNLSTGQ